jgi:hypothetical protein
MKIYKLVRNCTACRVLSHCVIANHIIHTVRKIIYKLFLRHYSSCIKFFLLFLGEVRKEKMSDSPHNITLPVPAYILFMAFLYEAGFSSPIFYVSLRGLSFLLLQLTPCDGPMPTQQLPLEKVQGIN